MKWIITLIVSLFAATVSFASAVSSVPKNVSINVNFNVQQPCETGEVDEFILKNKWTTASTNRSWSAIQDKVDGAGARFVLLGKIEKADAKAVTIKFLVLDTSNNTTKVLTPEMSVRYGQKGKMVLNEFDQRVELTVVATSK